MHHSSVAASALGLQIEPVSFVKDYLGHVNVLVPPEFDNTGSTFEGHVYSLGSTLSAALNFVIEPELEVMLGEEIQRLLEQMQDEKPEDRPLLQDIISLAEGQLSHTSSAAVCRKLSSIGRRVLSIESEASWEARWQHPKPRCLLRGLSSDDDAKNMCSGNSVTANGLSRKQVHDSDVLEEEIIKLCNTEVLILS
ncbi:kinase non-catalytic C-lobe domain-containing protein 1-like [Solea solea]|uniref:kinase non-catalytic C-lobe domain-containing protein 1-like n=1 Tax=Solea solea TaxID=90069 RepID=UPI00272C118D|nr:kinase non-catalytic C-lobe domain-containing protein 1-like [Solea solea]